MSSRALALLVAPLFFATAVRAQPPSDTEQTGSDRDRGADSVEDDEDDEDEDEDIDEGIDEDDELEPDEISPILPRRDPGLEAEAGTGANATVRVRPGNGVWITSDDDRYSLRIGLRAQLRATLDVPNGGDAGLDFAVRRARLKLSGHAFGQELIYYAQLAFSPEDLGLDDGGAATLSPLLDYVIELRYLRDLELVLGQYKRPFARERMTSSGALALVDRSIVDGELTLDRDLGFHLQSRDLFGLSTLRYFTGVSIGEGRDGDPSRNSGFLYFARVEFLPFGIFDDHAQVDFERRDEASVSVGAAYAFLDDGPGLRGLSGSRPQDGGTTDYHHAAIDVLLLFQGITVEMDALFRFGWREPGDAVDEAGNPLPIDAPSNGLGAFLQVSYLLPWLDLELGARGSILRALGDDTSFQDRGELGGGVAYYIARHAFSIHLDAFHLFGRDIDTDTSAQVRLQLEGIF